MLHQLFRLRQIRWGGGGGGGGGMRRFVAKLAVASVPFFLAACVASVGGGGGGSAPPSEPSRVGLFSHLAYDFGLLNTTRSGGREPDPVANRTLGLIYLEDAEVRARLPRGAMDYRVNYTLVGGTNDLTRAFFALNMTDAPGARLLFQVAPRYARRAYALNYVVNTLGVRALRVEAQISYLNASGGPISHEIVAVPVTIRAFATRPAANDLLVFDGISRSGTERRDRRITTTVPDQSFQGRLSQTINITRAGRDLGAFTARWVAEHYTPDAAEVRRADAPAAFDRTQLITSAAVRPDLAVTVTLTLNNNSAMRVTGSYDIAAGTNISVVNGNNSVDDSFLAFVRRLNTTRDFVALDAQDRVGPNVTAIAWSFSFPYTADVTTTRTQTETVPVRSLSYGTVGLVNENVPGRTCVLGRCFGGDGRAAGSLAADVPNVFSSFADAPGLGSSPAAFGAAPSAMGLVPGTLLDAARKGSTADASLFDNLGLRLTTPRGLVAGAHTMPTVYFRVRNVNSSERAYRCEDAYYYDNQVGQIRVRAVADGTAVDHEVQAMYGCRLEASLNGLVYEAVTTDLLTDALGQIDRVVGFVAEGSVNASQCGSANQTTRVRALRAGGCVYQAGLMIGVGDLNEAVELNVAGVMPVVDEAHVGAAGAMMAEEGVPLNTSAADPVLATLTYREPDENATGARLGVAVPRIVGVVPARVVPSDRAVPVDTAELFYLEAQADDRAALMLNASVAADVLDYEALAANATGQRGLRVTIQATDNSTARLITERVFNLEVQDVVYKPVRLTYMPLVVNHSVTSDPVEQRLLPGFAQFVANGGPVLGRVQAVDPETNTSAGLSYAYVGVALFNDVQNRSFVLSQGSGRPTADELLLVGVGLRDGDQFNVRLRAINESPRADATEDMNVRTVVDYAAVATAGPYTGAPPIQFNAGTFVGSVVEGEPGATVSSARQPGRNIGADLVAPADDDRSFFIMTRAEIGVLLGTLGPNMRTDVQRALARSLDVLSDPTQFNLNQTSGALFLGATTTADFTTNPVYTLLLRVANTTEQTPAAYLRSDYALVQVVVEDRNRAPELMNLRAVHATVTTGASFVRFADLPEDTPAGTVLATLQVRDDNPLTGVNFAPAAGATAYKIERTAASRRVAATAAEGAHYVASYRLVTVDPDYEANAMLNVVHALADNGRYMYDPARQTVMRLGNPVNTTVLRINGSITNVNEAPVLRFTPSRVDLAENAAEGDEVVTVRAEDPEGLAANLTYTLTTVPASLAAAFNVSADTMRLAEGRVATWALRVADADALENAGDGQIFTLTLTARDLGGQRARAHMEVSVQDVPALRPAAVNTTLITLSEQQALDAPDRVLRAPLFQLVEVQPDYDEYFVGLGPRETRNPVRFGDLAFASGAIGYVDARGMPATTITRELHNEERFNLFTLQEENAAVNLVLGEAGLIEPNLLGGNVTLEVRLTDPAGAGTPQTARVPVAIVPTSPRGLRFANARANGAHLADEFVPAAYNFAYEQTAYVEPLSERACAQENATQITYDAMCHAAVPVRVDANSPPVLFVRRDVANQNMLEAPATVTSVNNTFGIVLTETAGLTADVIAIYVLDAEGNLAEATADFETYFSYRLNTSYVMGDANRTALLIEQKTHEMLYANGSVRADARYAALDTLPLDRRAGNQERVLSYFFVAGDGMRNASRRALAQVNVRVKSAGLNERARVTQLRLGALDLLGGLNIRENGEGETGFPTDVINNPRDVLTLTITNPDGEQRNQTVNTTIDIVATEGDQSPTSSGVLMLMMGRAAGNALVRLGRDADAHHELILAHEQQNGTRMLPFQLARNVYGRAYIRLRFEERDAAGALAGRPHYAYIPIEVRDVAEAASDIAEVRVAQQVSGVAEEDGLGASPQLNITLTNEQFGPPRHLEVGVAVDATNAVDSPYAGLTVNRDASPSVMPVVNRTEVKYVVLQELIYRMHGYGTTRFMVTTTGRERRGFGEQVYTYPARPLPLREFTVRHINDEVRACASAACTQEDIPANYNLRRDFENRTRLNQLTDSRGNLIVYFTDVDMTTGRALPMNTDVLVNVNPQPQPLNGTTSITLTDGANFAVTQSAIRVAKATAAADEDEIRVSIPVRLGLDGAQYDAILTEEGAVINVTIGLRDSDNRSIVAYTNGSISISDTTANAEIDLGGYANRPTVRVLEETEAERDLPIQNITITDDDIRRRTGDVYTYTLTVTRASDGQAITDLLKWRDGTMRPLQGQADNRFTSVLRLAKQPQDQDVGSYMVQWSIRERSGSDGSSRLVGEGTLTLVIMNVEDAVTTFCDLATAGDDCGYQGATFYLQDIFGNQSRTNTQINTVRDTGQQITVLFEDPDLLVPGGNFVPGAMNVSAENAQLNVSDTDQGAVTLDTSMTLSPQDLGMGRINVTVPLRLRLSQAQYDAINADSSGGTVAFEIVLRAGPASARAQARASINVRLNRAIVTEQPMLTNNNLLALAEDRAAQTNIGPALTIRDADRQRSTGNEYIYTVTVRDANGMLISDLVEWDLTGSGGEYRQQTANANAAAFMQRLRLARSPSDADVAGSVYTVAWAIDDANTANGRQQVEQGRFRLNITNINDPLTVVCDANDAAADCGFQSVGYLISALDPASTSGFIRSASEAEIRFEDVDLAAGLQLNQTVGNFGDADATDVVELNGTNFRVPPAAISVVRGTGNQIRVSFPVELQLTTNQYSAIQAVGDVVSLRFNFTLGDTGAARAVGAEGIIQLQPDTDGDGIGDEDDLCPLLRPSSPGADQVDDDGDGIGNPCEARPVTGVLAVPGVDTMTLNWTNPSDGDLQVLNISIINLATSSAHPPVMITNMADLGQAARVQRRIVGLDAATRYRFTVSGIDFRHGRRNQTIPPATLVATTLADTDMDTIADRDDNCVTTMNTDQADADQDGAGDACEAEPVRGLMVVSVGATTANLSWTNPADSALQRLDVTYREIGGMDTGTRMSTAAQLLTAGGAVGYQVSGLTQGTAYQFTVGGLDFRSGRSNQSLPLVAVNATTLPDMDDDSIVDGLDNCLLTPNPTQTDADMDTYGDACGPDENGNGIREIQTAAQLDTMRYNLSEDFELLTDIDLGGYPNWRPIGATANLSRRASDRSLEFTGSLNGNNKTISNLNIHGYRYAGLFAQLRGATVRDLHLVVGNITVNATTASFSPFAGSLAGRDASSSIIFNVHATVKGSIDYPAPQITISSYGGGLFGEAHSTAITNSSAVVEGNISSFTETAGLVGLLNGVADPFRSTSHFMRNSYAWVRGDIIAILGASDTTRVAAAGLAAASTGNWGLINCYARTDGRIISRGRVEGGARVLAGGLLGGLGLGHDSVVNSYAVSQSIEAVAISVSEAGATSAGGLIAADPSSVFFLGAMSNNYYATQLISANLTSPFGDNRTLTQLECPESPGATCGGNTTYVNWDSTIWDFGDNETLPTLRIPNPRMRD